MVTFRMFAAARVAAGAAEIAVGSGPTNEVVGALTAGLPARFAQVLAACSLMCDGRRLDPNGSEPLADAAIVDVLPPFAGG